MPVTLTSLLQDLEEHGEAAWLELQRIDHDRRFHQS